MTPSTTPNAALPHRHQKQHACCGSCAPAQPEPPRAADPCCTPGAGHGDNDRETAAQREATSVSLEGTRPVRYRIDNMDCPTEERLIRGKLEPLAGVTGLEFNLMQRVLKVRHRFVDLAPLQQLVAQLGMQAEPLEAGAPAPAGM